MSSQVAEAAAALAVATAEAGAIKATAITAQITAGTLPPDAIAAYIVCREATAAAVTVVTEAKAAAMIAHTAALLVSTTAATAAAAADPAAPAGGLNVPTTIAVDSAGDAWVCFFRS